MGATLALHDLHQAHGATFEERQGWRVPVRYADTASEVATLRQSTALVDVSDRGWIRVTGDDRTTFLQGQLSNDVAKTPPGRGCHATLLTRVGKLVSDLRLWSDPDAHWLDTDSDRADVTVQTLDRFVISEDVVLETVGAGFAHVVAAGPTVRSTVASGLGTELPALEPYAHAVLGSGTRVANRRAAGVDLLELWVPVAEAAGVWKALVDAGAAPIGRDAWDLAALEAGEARWALDVDDSNIPLEANLDDAISYTKGCYVGQEVIAKATHLGRVNKRLVGLAHEGEPLAHDDAVELDGESDPIGRVTRGAFSPTLARPIALAYVKWKHADPGTALAVRRGDGSRIDVKVVKLPFLENLR